ncbi:Transcriptional regulatory protein EmbR [Actinomadura rubteroloni]|uniref:Transcriptional regulatory protein EmbR n=1 Tax=Actinomadura rubteroloni TaxID=1926885 RepID=A0A2P4UKG4_9ACTN|nr:SAM-dependent methyltransferase [Actinomadura rubteroloni]POM25489.1 Transcriptional regulatory protein EmbR [Actinomadura rubteroloni]
MRVSVLGELRLTDDAGRTLDLGEGRRRRRNLRALICVLALEDRPVPSSRLKALLWDDPDRDHTSVLTNLVAQARRVLPPGRLVTETGTAGARLYRLARRAVDADDFVRDAERGDAARDRGRLATAAVHYRRAMAPWQGVSPDRTLHDLPDTEGARARVDPLRALRVRVAESLVAVQLDLGRQSPELVEEIGGHLAFDPANENLHRDRLVALYRLGRRTDALRAYRDAAAAIEAELGVPPGPALRRVHEQIAAGTLPPHAGEPDEPRARPVLRAGGLSYRGVTDYTLGGKDNTEAERAFVDKIIADTGTDATLITKDNRDCVLRMVRTLAGRGVRQFLDLGSGLPEQISPSVHQTARTAADEPPRVVYIDNDPVVAITSRAMYSGAGVAFHELDLMDVEAVLDAASRCLDFAEPIGLIAANSLQYVGDVDDDLGTGQVTELVTAYVDALVPGSYLAVTHITGDGIDPRLRRYIDSTEPGAALPQHLRTTGQIERLLVGLPLLPPGLTDVGAWRPERPFVRRDLRIIGGIGAKV